VGRYAFAILGLLVLVGIGGGGFVAYSAHKHDTTMGWEYQRLTQHTLPSALSGGKSTRQAKTRLKTDLNTLTVEHTSTLDSVLSNADRVAEKTAARPTRNKWLTGDHDSN
jgi:hypothetical protein